MNDTLELVYVVRRRNSHWTYMSVVSYIVCYSPIWKVSMTSARRWVAPQLMSCVKHWRWVVPSKRGWQQRCKLQHFGAGLKITPSLFPGDGKTFNAGCRTKKQRHTFCVMCVLWTNRWLSECYKLQSESYSGKFGDSVIMMVFKLFSSHAVHGNKQCTKNAESATGGASLGKMIKC